MKEQFLDFTALEPVLLNKMISKLRTKKGQILLRKDFRPFPRGSGKPCLCAYSWQESVSQITDCLPIHVSMGKKRLLFRAMLPSELNKTLGSGVVLDITTV